MLNCFDQMVNCAVKVNDKTSQKSVETCAAKVKKLDLSKHWDDYKENK